MPSPPIPSRAYHRPQLPSSSRSAISGPPLRSSPWTQKVAIGKLLRRKPQELSRDSNLTEENLEAHNRIHDIFDQKKCSPYYKGLTDSSLVTSKNPNNNNSNNNRPGSPESHATAVTSSSSFYTLINKVQEWGSCFSVKTKKRHGEALAGAPPPAAASSHQVSYSFLSAAVPASSPSVTLVKEVNKVTYEKPLRERVLEPEPRSKIEPSTVLEAEAKPKARAKAEAKPKGRAKAEADKPKLQAKNVSGVVKEMDAKAVYTWADRYRPKSLSDFICNRDKAIYLKNLMRSGDCGHFIFQGPAGVGKRTMIWAMLAETFGPDRVQAREDCRTFDLKGGAVDHSIRVNMKHCLEHVEVSLADYLGYEKLVELIKEAQTKLSNKALRSSKDTCRAIIIYEAEKMSGDALLYIRWLLERYKGYNKVFFCCSDVSKLQPVKTICTTVELLPPSNAEIVEVLKFIAKKESIELPVQLVERIADNSKNNLRQAIRSFEATCRFSYPPLEKDQVIFTGWEEDIANIAKNIIKEQSPKQLYIIRGELQNLTEHNVSPEFIFESLVEELKKQLDEEQHQLVDNLYDEYNNNDKSSSIFAYNRAEDTDKKLIDPSKKNFTFFFRIEEFIAKFMSSYKTILLSKTTEKDDSSS